MHADQKSDCRNLMLTLNQACLVPEGHVFQDGILEVNMHLIAKLVSF